MSLITVKKFQYLIRTALFLMMYTRCILHSSFIVKKQQQPKNKKKPICT